MCSSRFVIAADSLQSRLGSINNGQWDEAWTAQREPQRRIMEGTVGLNIPALTLRLHGLGLDRDGNSAITWVFSQTVERKFIGSSTLMQGHRKRALN